ncbi:G-protein coupled receptor 54-like [Branchiostoma floridae]|uniref:G-protein coupled receptor 54-like n=2 Tax=Branchiostoma floridae TaxID=7739 RepID=A0A9J7LUE7_BRAFL|nr:G-protein coupled receptor 54-like [Branchiostoma floridae]
MDNFTEDFIDNTSARNLPAYGLRYNRTFYDPGAKEYIFATFCGVILLIGGVGNSLVIYIVARYSDMRTVTNYYKVNLAVTDLAFLVCCVPFATIKYLTYDWIFGKTMCTFVPYMTEVSVLATCITLAVLSIDRYCAVVHPLRSINFRTPKVAAIISGCTWIGSFLIALPIGMNLQLMEVVWLDSTEYLCRPKWPTLSARKSYTLYTFLITYVIPLLICTVSCSLIVRSILNRFSMDHAQEADVDAQLARRTSCMVVGVVVLFAVCWLPIQITFMWYEFGTGLSETTYWLQDVAKILCYSNSAVNPFVYTLLGKNYRRCIKLSFPCLFRQERPKQGSFVTFSAKDASTEAVTMSCFDEQKEHDAKTGV